MQIIAKLFAVLAVALTLPAAAQNIPGMVGRIAHIEGSAAVYQDPDEGWERAYVNSPVTSENSIWTDPDSRAELRVAGTALRLDEATQVDIARLDENELDAFVPRGSVAVRVRHYGANQRIRFNTPFATFSLRANGQYRIDVDPDREEARITVHSGDARVGSESGRVRVASGETVRVFGGAGASYVVERAYADPFDRWARERDSRWVETNSTRYVSPNMTGYEDLDAYGTWREEPGYGALWYPTRVEADWAPYRYGHWDYVRPWGWTWIDDQPWGYAPSHYGRWVNVNNRWGWYPGTRVASPTWAPALVAWFGGSNFSVGISSGSPSVGWYPLSPWDRYQPWYQASPTYVTNVNIIVRNETQNDRFRSQWRETSRERGATVVNRSAMVDRVPVQRAVVRVQPEVIRRAAAQPAAQPSAVLPTKTEVVQRRQTQRTQAATAQAQTAAAQRGEKATSAPRPAAPPPATPAARPDFGRARAAPAAAPQQAKAAPAPAAPVTRVSPQELQVRREQQVRERGAAAQEPPGSRNEAQQQQAQKAREDQQAAQKAREEQQQQARQRAEQERAQGQKAREDQQQQAQKSREEQQQQAQKAREAQQQQAQKAREEQQQGQKAREEQQQQARQRAEQERAQQQQAQKSREEQQQQAQKAREVQQQQQAQQRAAQQQQAQKAREEQQQAQKAREEQQQQAQKAREAQQQQQGQQRATPQQQQQQAQERAAQQQQAAQEKAAQQQQAQERQRQAQQQRAAAKAEKDKEKEEEEKKKSGR